MNQSRLASFYEACFNTAIGFVISFCMSVVVFPLFGFHPTLDQNFWITCIFTVTSVARGYLVRRHFNTLLQRAAQRLAGAAQ